MHAFSIYIIDDEEIIRSGLEMALEPDYQVKTFGDAETAIDAIKITSPDLILLDIGLPGISGIDALKKIKHINPEILVIIITAYEDIETVISAMKLGAYDYVVKPIQMDGMEVTIGNAFDTIKLKKEVQSLHSKFLNESLPCFIGESNKIQTMMDFLSKVAKSPDTPILILGETGTGKELIASAIHYRSPNFKGRLVTINCAAIPKDLIESEIFGYEEGAFSGAKSSGKKGLIEEAENGTLFLDEIGDLSLEAQAALLRFLENGEFYRIGGTKRLHVQTRVISATNKDIDSMIENDSFRKDLYFRIGVLKINIPSLNERRDDIMPLAKHFLYEFNRKFDSHFTTISPDAETFLVSFNWTGHVRELKNIIEKAVLVGTEPVLTVKDLDIEHYVKDSTKDQINQNAGFSPIPPEGMDLSAAQEAFEKHYIEEALKIADGNESKAARLLNINHHTFRYRKKKLLE
ncbi:MAG: sigma-54 dependent transcriptional regulator [Desulfobacterales bacterium]|nr:sigma-54 dependent transcriptional regulator [Desulfobacterales bacterium]